MPDIDMNRFNGTLNELVEFAGVGVPIINLNELYETLASRTKAVEDVVNTFNNPSGKSCSERPGSTRGQPGTTACIRDHVQCILCYQL